MLPDDAFLRRLPNVLDAGQALRLEALVFSTDIINANYEVVTAIAGKHRDRISDLKRTHRVQLFSQLWSIVDNLHVCFQLFESLGLAKTRPDVEELMAKYESATLLRNKMAHLNQNIGNLASSKDKIAPIFGSLTYLVVPPSHIEENADGSRSIKCGRVAVTAGSMRFGWKSEMINPAGRELTAPVCGFEFQAFGMKLPVENALEEMNSLMDRINCDLKDLVLDQVTIVAEERSLSVEQLMAHSGEGYKFYLEFQGIAEGSDET